MGARRSQQDAVAAEDKKNGNESGSAARYMLHDAGPSLAAVVIMLSLIFGGCCSNVRALVDNVNCEHS